MSSNSGLLCCIQFLTNDLRHIIKTFLLSTKYRLNNGVEWVLALSGSQCRRRTTLNSNLFQEVIFTIVFLPLSRNWTQNCQENQCNLTYTLIHKIISWNMMSSTTKMSPNNITYNKISCIIKESSIHNQVYIMNLVKLGVCFVFKSENLRTNEFSVVRLLDGKCHYQFPLLYRKWHPV